MAPEENLLKIKEIVEKEKGIINELGSLLGYAENAKNQQESSMINGQINILKNSIKKENDELLKTVEPLDIKKKLNPLSSQVIPKDKISKTKEISSKKTVKKKESKGIESYIKQLRPKKDYKISDMEKEVISRLKKKKEKKVEKKDEKPSEYIKFANKLFSDKVRTFLKEKKLVTLEKDLIKSNMNYTAISYASMLMLTTVITAIASFVLFIILLFFNIGIEFPILTLANENIGLRFLKVFWIIFVIPAAVGLFMYFYPSMERKSVERKINQELPFATIHMSAISGSMVEPIKIFSILAYTKEYPALEREFNKLLNQINIYGYDLVTALKDSAVNCPSQKLAELFNGLATTITSGGSLFAFFEKRAQTMLFDYRLDKEKNTKTAETFMDIYISVVIAAPMILMLLLMMMKVSGIGVSFSTSMITFIVVGGVSLINVIFLSFLQLKQPETS